MKDIAASCEACKLGLHKSNIFDVQGRRNVVAGENWWNIFSTFFFSRLKDFFGNKRKIENIEID